MFATPRVSRILLSFYRESFLSKSFFSFFFFLMPIYFTFYILIKWKSKSCWLMPAFCIRAPRSFFFGSWLTQNQLQIQILLRISNVLTGYSETIEPMLMIGISTLSPEGFFRNKIYLFKIWSKIFAEQNILRAEQI